MAKNNKKRIKFTKSPQHMIGNHIMKIKNKGDYNLGKELFVTIAMNDGSILHKTKIGFLDEYGVFDWITDINVLKSIVNNQMDTRMLAFSTNHVQGKLIKQNIKSISVEV